MSEQLVAVITRIGVDRVGLSVKGDEDSYSAKEALLDHTEAMSISRQLAEAATAIRLRVNMRKQQVADANS